MPIIIILIFIFLLVIVPGFRVIRQYERGVVFTLGKYSGIRNPGLRVVIPYLQTITRVDVRTTPIDVAKQEVITKDNVTMQIDTVVYFQITDPKLYTYGVVGPITAIENLTATTLRNIIGDLELDETLTSRDIINTQMRSILDEATDPWGIKVRRVEVKNILPPRDIQEAMEKQMRAERERRESILKAEGDKRSAILVAEGEKESAVLRAQAEKESALLRAEAKKEATIKEAEGKAEALVKVYEAQAKGIELIKNSNPTKEYLSLKSLETYEKIADGQATKIVVPSELQSVATLLTNAKEIVKD